LDINNSE